MATEKSWMEQHIGWSWETSLAAYAAAIGAIMAMVGALFDAKELLVFGIGAMGAAGAFMGQQARSQKQHDRDAARQNRPPETPR
jgi:hypothetical protein